MAAPALTQIRHDDVEHKARHFVYHLGTFLGLECGSTLADYGTAMGTRVSDSLVSLFVTELQERQVS